jgi:hypothetical protein
MHTHTISKPAPTAGWSPVWHPLHPLHPPHPPHPCTPVGASARRLCQHVQPGHPQQTELLRALDHVAHPRHTAERPPRLPRAAASHGARPNHTVELPRHRPAQRQPIHVSNGCPPPRSTDNRPAPPPTEHTWASAAASWVRPRAAAIAAAREGRCCVRTAMALSVLTPSDCAATVWLRQRPQRLSEERVAGGRGRTPRRRWRGGGGTLWLAWGRQHGTALTMGLACVAPGGARRDCQLAEIVS